MLGACIKGEKKKGVDSLTFGTRLEELRNKRGISKSEMARRLYVNQPTYFHWENGDSIPHLEVIKTLASMFGTSLDYLCDFKPTLKPEDSYQQALFRLREMKVEFEDEEKIITLNVSGVKYAVKASDLAKLIEMADVQLQKMMDSLKLSMYQSALISAFGSGVVDFSQEYSKGLADEILTDVDIWSKEHTEIDFTPQVLEDIARDYLLDLPGRVRQDIWNEVVDELVVSEWIDIQEESEWKCPSFKKKRKGRKKKGTEDTNTTDDSDK